MPVVTLALALAYVAGFLVVNSYYGQFQIVDVSEFQVHYLITAALFAATTAVPVISVFIARDKIQRGWTRWKAAVAERRWGRITAFLIYWLVVCIGVLLSWGLVMVLLAHGEYSDWRHDAALYLGLLLVTMWMWRHLAQVVRSDGWQRKLLRMDQSDFLQVIVGSFLVVALASVYGRLIYPHVRADVGGGTIWVAEVTLRPESTILPWEGATLRGAVLSSDGNHLRLVLCDQEGDDRNRLRVEISRSDVGLLRLERRAALPSLLRMCPRPQLQEEIEEAGVEPNAK